MRGNTEQFSVKGGHPWNVDYWHLYTQQYHRNSIHPKSPYYLNPSSNHITSKDIRTGLYRTSASGVESFWEILKAMIGLVMFGAFQGKRIQLICMASRICWPAVLLQSYAFSVLTSMFSGTLKSAVTFTVTSEHALCFSLGSGSSFLPLGLADYALPQKKRLKSLQIFHVRMHCVRLHNTECLSVHIAYVWSSDSRVSKQLVARSDRRRWELLKEDGTITMPHGSEAASIREATFSKSILPHHILEVSHLHFPSFKDRLSPCQSFGSCLEGCLSTAAPWGEAGWETDRLTDRQELVPAVDGSVQKKRTGPWYTMFNSPAQSETNILICWFMELMLTFY